MKMIRSIVLAAFLLSNAAVAQTVVPGGGGGGGAPSGAAGGSLTGTYPNPGLNLGGTNTNVLPVVNGGVDQAVWTSYTPTVNCTTASCTATGRYKTLGKTTFVAVTVSVTGTTGTINSFTLPLSAAAVVGEAVMSGRENAVTGLLWTGRIASGAASAVTANQSNAQAVSAGYSITFSGVYEIP